jgi:N-acetylglucosaminyldiphosphoundecaprenol N-acetyl-beta-D-mannosaminyltransferase
VNVLGVGVSAITVADAVATISQWIARREQNYVCVTGVHGVMESQRDPALRRIHNAAGMVTADGMPLVWLGRRAGHDTMERVYGPDLMLASCAASQPQHPRHYFVGSTPDVLSRLVGALRARFPVLNVCGTNAPPYRPLTPAEDDALVATINSASPDIVWVGLGTPKQERWMADHLGRINAPVMIGVGAAFDFLAGTKRQAPRWMQRSGLEWLFRMLSEPRRLGARYLVNNPSFVWRVLLQSLGLRRIELDGAS